MFGVKDQARFAMASRPLWGLGSYPSHRFDRDRVSVFEGLIEPASAIVSAKGPAKWTAWLMRVSLWWEGLTGGVVARAKQSR